MVLGKEGGNRFRGKLMNVEAGLRKTSIIIFIGDQRRYSKPLREPKVTVQEGNLR